LDPHPVHFFPSSQHHPHLTCISFDLFTLQEDVPFQSAFIRNTSSSLFGRDVYDRRSFRDDPFEGVINDMESLLVVFAAALTREDDLQSRE
jgi:hypothetical protein